MLFGKFRGNQIKIGPPPLGPVWLRVGCKTQVPCNKTRLSKTIFIFNTSPFDLRRNVAGGQPSLWKREKLFASLSRTVIIKSWRDAGAMNNAQDGQVL